MQNDSLFDDELENQEVSIADLDASMNLIREKEAEYKEIDAVRKAKREELDDATFRFTKLLEKARKTRWEDANGGFTTYIKRMFATPKTMEEKKAFLKWACGDEVCSILHQDEEAIYWSLVGVNSQTLNTFVNNISEHFGKNEEFIPEGLTQPNYETMLRSLPKKKGKTNE